MAYKLRTKIISLCDDNYTLGVPVKITVDAWMAEIQVVINQSDALLWNGIPNQSWAVYDLVGAGSSVTRIVIGGAVVDGKPVNIDEVWTFVYQIGAKVVGSIILTYCEDERPRH